MVFNTVTVAGVVTPAVIQTFLSHVGQLLLPTAAANQPGPVSLPQETARPQTHRAYLVR
jgi:hypothetical protein